MKPVLHYPRIKAVLHHPLLQHLGLFEEDAICRLQHCSGNSMWLRACDAEVPEHAMVHRRLPPQSVCQRTMCFPQCMKNLFNIWYI